MIRGKKGKAPTKGAKQIITENAATVTFYRNMALAAGVFYNIGTFIFFYETISSGVLFINVCVIATHTLCYQVMLYVSRPRFSEKSQVLDSGLDLNMEGGLGENIKDVTILLSITQVLAVFSNYFWFLLLLLPIRVCIIVWTNILGPWFFQQPPVETELDEKKKRKMERKMNKHYYQ